MFDVIRRRRWFYLLSLATTILPAFVLGNSFAAVLMQRYGLRRIVCVAMALMMTGYTPGRTRVPGGGFC